MSLRLFFPTTTITPQQEAAGPVSERGHRPPSACQTAPIAGRSTGQATGFSLFQCELPVSRVHVNVTVCPLALVTTLKETTDPLMALFPGLHPSVFHQTHGASGRSAPDLLLHRFLMVLHSAWPRCLELPTRRRKRRSRGGQARHSHLSLTEEELRGGCTSVSQPKMLAPQLSKMKKCRDV